MTDISVREILDKRSRPLLSFEFFPPKTEKGKENLIRAINTLEGAHPDFVTITYGAGGATRARSLEIAGTLYEHHFSPVMPHLTCVGVSREALGKTIDGMVERGHRNIMALRGDPPAGDESFEPHPDGLHCARDLVAFIKERHPNVCVGVAGYPEGHPEAESVESEMAYLKEKIDAGADFITTQLFFENQYYFDFVARCRQIGIKVPILPGLLPAVSLKQVQRFTALCGCQVPPELEQMLARAGDDKRRSERTGILWCMDQIADLLHHDVPGIHLYILNRSRPALSYNLAQSFYSAAADEESEF